MSAPGEPRRPKRVIIPLEVRSGKLAPFYGGEMPRFLEGTVVDLVADSDVFIDEADISRFDLEETVTILRGGQKLLAVMRWRSPLPAHETVKISSLPGLSGNSAFVPFTLVDDLRLHLRGAKLAELEDCECRLDTVPNASASSINHAYTKLSERYETWRKSHAGNVFDMVYFIETDTARPLVVLRDRATAEFEKKLFHRSGTLPLEPRVRKDP